MIIVDNDNKRLDAKAGMNCISIKREETTILRTRMKVLRGVELVITLPLFLLNLLALLLPITRRIRRDLGPAGPLGTSPLGWPICSPSP